MADTVMYIVKVGEFYVETWNQSISSLHLDRDRETALNFRDTSEEEGRALSLAKRLGGKSVRVQTSVARTEKDCTE